MLRVENITKKFDGRTALDGVSFDVPQGSVFGLLGPNGAGKTTLIRIVNQILQADGGSVLLDGKPIGRESSQLMGYLPEERGLYKKMRVEEQLLYLARLKGLEKKEALAAMDEWMGRLAMDEWRKRKVGELSKGMQQKVQFVATVMHRPKLLIFDEPFSGFDPVNAEDLKREIAHLQAGGATVVLSSHNMESVEEMCDRMVLLDHGKVLLNDRVADIKNRFEGRALKDIFIEQIKKTRTI